MEVFPLSSVREFCGLYGMLCISLFRLYILQKLNLISSNRYIIDIICIYIYLFIIYIYILIFIYVYLKDVKYNKKYKYHNYIEYILYRISTL